MRTHRRAARWGTTVAASALLGTYLVVTGPTASVDPLAPSAGTTYLCSGYKECNKAGYPHAGYKKASKTMYWRMYAGHNCTNYVAYRMVRAGMPNVRPWTGGGNASEWGKHMAALTDQVPNVGAVAWWGRYSNGSGSAGHVAYVERVVSADEIIVSEDSWGGTFHWRRITRASGRWPTGFIHFVDKIVAGTGAPQISGVPQVGAVLTASTGGWSGDPTAFAYQWLAGGVAVPGATGSTYTPGPETVGKAVTVQVSASKPGATGAVQTSAPTAPITVGDFALTTPPEVTGTLVVDNVLTASAGTWSPTPAETVWRWFADGVRIEGNTSASLPLTSELVGRTISLKVVARQSGFEKLVSSSFPVGQVLAGVVTATAPATVSGTPALGEVLTVTPGAYAPSGSALAYRWLRNGVPIAGASGASYQLAAEDVGATVAPEITASAPQMLAHTQTLPATATVTSPPVVELTTKPTRGRAVVRVRVTAAGAVPVTGSVRIRIARWSDDVRLEDGVAKVRVPMAAGRKSVRVRYLGSAVVPASSKATGTVRVR